jgi:hypothetical protein
LTASEVAQLKLNACRARNPIRRCSARSGTTTWLLEQHGPASSTGRRDPPPSAIETLCSPRADAQHGRPQRS